MSTTHETEILFSKGDGTANVSKNSNYIYINNNYWCILIIHISIIAVYYISNGNNSFSRFDLLLFLKLCFTERSNTQGFLSSKSGLCIHTDGPSAPFTGNTSCRKVGVSQTFMCIGIPWRQMHTMIHYCWHEDNDCISTKFLGWCWLCSSKDRQHMEY
jgi:hypothetical protein